MAKTHPHIDVELKTWIAQQPVYFLASAPLQADGHINLSPRGLDSLRILGDTEVLVLDLTGSGNETAAHLAENARLTIMFCAFTAEPRILRLYGHGAVITPRTEKWQTYRQHFPTDVPGVRQLFHVTVNRVQTSCGFGVPLMDFVAQRDMLTQWAEKKGVDGVRAYQQQKNICSIDGLIPPSLE